MTIVTKNLITETGVNTTTGQLSPLEHNAQKVLGTFIANGATPVTVVDTNVTANSTIIPTLKTVGGTVSISTPAVQTITPGTGFTIAALALDTSTYNYLLIG